MPAAYTDQASGNLRTLVIAAGLCWSVAFAAIALIYQLQLYGDGAIFSYAVAVRDVWAFHWHNISGRVSVYFLTLWPAEIYVRLTNHPAGGIAIYGFLFYIAPLASLIATFLADASKRRVIFTAACCSTALLCPLVFGFPTEMWMAHALFWPTLALLHYARTTAGGALLSFIAALALALAHTGGLLFVFTIAATLAARGLRDALFRRAAFIALAVTLIRLIVKAVYPPDDYFGPVWLRAARHFFDPAIAQTHIALLLAAAIAGYGLICLILSRRAPHTAHLFAAAMIAAALAVYWIWFEDSVHASDRYYLRTALVLATPLIAAVASLSATRTEGRLVLQIPFLESALDALARPVNARIFAGGFLLVTLVHAVETGKFVMAWTQYKDAVAALATGDAADPALGDPRFVSSARIPPALNRLSWFSTTPYLSAVLAGFVPNRLVIAPDGNYFWLSCETATANAKAERAVSAKTRELVRIYSCLHRK